MTKKSLKIIAAFAVIGATIAFFQNCAQPAPETDDTKTQPSVTSDPELVSSFSPSNPQIGQQILITTSGGSPPYTHTVISGSANVAGNYVIPNNVGTLEVQTKDTKNKTVFHTIYVTAAPGSVNTVTNGTFTVPAGIYSLTVKAWGAGGGGGGGDDNIQGGAGGGGAYVGTTVAVTPGMVFQIIVGVGGLPGASDTHGTGSGAGGGAGSGGAAGGVSGTSGDSGSGGGGGGGTFLISSGNVYVAAAGGGGGGGAGIRSTTGLGVGGPGGVKGGNGGVAGGAFGGTATSQGEQGGTVSGDGGGGGGGGGGYRGGKGGQPGNGDVTGGGGGGGSNYPTAGAVVGSGRSPGSDNSAEPLRAGAGVGGIAGAKGADGRIVVTY